MWLAAAITSLAYAGLINAYLDGSDTPLPANQVAQAVADPDTWVPEDVRRHWVELTPTAAGGAIISVAGDVYSFRNR